MGCQTFSDLKEITKPWKYDEEIRTAVRTYRKIRAQEIYPSISRQVLVITRERILDYLKVCHQSLHLTGSLSILTVNPPRIRHDYRPDVFKLTPIKGEVSEPP